MKQELIRGFLMAREKYTIGLTSTTCGIHFTIKYILTEFRRYETARKKIIYQLTKYLNF